jgi:hypothetical protein
MTMAVCLLALLLVTGCGGKYSDVEKTNKEYVEIVENYIAALDKADDSKSVVKAMNNFSDELEALWPKMRELADKYPELENEENLPEELKESQQRAEEVGVRMATSFMKLMKYMDDPEVLAAQERMGKIMMQR